MVSSVLSLTDQEFHSMATSLIDEIEESSVFFETHEKRHVPILSMSEIKLGNILGEGGFCNVYEIVRINKHREKNESKEMENPSDDKTVKTMFSAITDCSNEINTISSLSDKCNNGKRSALVMKMAKKNLFGSNKIYTRALVDISVEVKFLSALNHQNIIKVRGVAKDDDGSIFSLIMDRLYLTLTEQLTFWRKRVQRSTGFLGIGACGGNSIECNKLLSERIGITVALASAMKHMHLYRLVYRDLKPDNIGFDTKGVLKIFDFGLCKELRSRDLDKTSSTTDMKLYNLTEYAGSLGYMSPEVYFGEPYNCLTDVFSFSMVLFQIIYLKPLYTISGGIEEMGEKIYVSDMRPTIPTKHRNSQIARLIEQSWSSTISNRPAMSQIYSTLKRVEAECKQCV